MLTVLGEAPRKGRQVMLSVRCDCGTERASNYYNIIRGGTRSCGCNATAGQKAATEAWIKKAQERAATVLAIGKFRCGRCKELLPVSDFNACKTTLTGLQDFCRACIQDYRFVKAYGVTAAYKQQLIDEQGGVCRIRGCGQRVDLKSPLDHCHESGQVRAVLCTPCNRSLGALRENPRRIRGLAEYAEQWKQLRLVPAKESA